jgi:sugar lactone lactonase YvrE
MEVAIHAQALLGEGPRWDAAARRLLWVDIEGEALHVFDPARDHDRTIRLGARVGAAAPTASGDVLVALADRLATVDLEDGTTRTVAEIPHGPELRLNDGACDAAGRFWVGSMALDERPAAAALYRYAGDGALDLVLDAVTLSNGLGWSPDGATMYYVDSLTYRIDAFDFDLAAGELSGRRQWVAIEPGAGIPDGLAVDGEGGVWLALWGGAAVRRYSPDGALDRVLEVPTDNVTACCFGGEDGTSLYVTTASVGLAGEQPLAGDVFVAEVDVAGPPAQPFAG